MIAFLTILDSMMQHCSLYAWGHFVKPAALISKSGFQMDICKKPATCLCKMRFEIRPGVCHVAPLLYWVLFGYSRARAAR